VLIADRDQTIASLRTLLKSRDDEIADLKRDCSRLQGRIEQYEQQGQRDSLAAWFP
jgi:phage shock protein A